MVYHPGKEFVPADIIPMSDTKLAELKRRNQKGQPTLATEKHDQTGWPTNKRDSLNEYVPFWNL